MEHITVDVIVQYAAEAKAALDAIHDQHVQLAYAHPDAPDNREVSTDGDTAKNV